MNAWKVYCDRSPPLQVMVQAYLDYKPVHRKSGGSGDELLTTLSAFPGAVPKSR